MCKKRKHIMPHNCHLQVMVDEKLKFHDHIQEMINKAYSMLGIIKRNFKYMDKAAFMVVHRIGKKYSGVQYVSLIETYIQAYQCYQNR